MAVSYFRSGGYDEPDVENLRKDWREFRDVLDYYGITRLYHFTDRSNISGITRSGGLLSWRRICRQGVNVPCPGGSDTSHSLDESLGLDGYVRLSFVKDHPMKAVALKEGRIDDPVVLEISTDVLFDERVIFTDRNAARKAKGFGQGGDIGFFRDEIHFNLFKRSYFDIDDSEKPYYQAEVLVPDIVPLCYILNREECGIRVPQEMLISPARKAQEERRRQEDEMRRKEAERRQATDWVKKSLELHASKTLIREGQGEQVVLWWNAIPSEYKRYVNFVKLDGRPQPANSLTVTPVKTTTYTLSVDVGGEVVEKSVTVNVVPLAVADFKADFEYVVAGSEVTLRWKVENAQSVELEGYGLLGSLSGSVDVRVDSDTSFTLIVTDKFGAYRVSARVRTLPVPLFVGVSVSWPEVVRAPQVMINEDVLDNYRQRVMRIEIDKDLMAKTLPYKNEDVENLHRVARTKRKTRFSSVRNFFESIVKMINR